MYMYIYIYIYTVNESKSERAVCYVSGRLGPPGVSSMLHTNFGNASVLSATRLLHFLFTIGSPSIFLWVPLKVLELTFGFVRVGLGLRKNASYRFWIATWHTVEGLPIFVCGIWALQKWASSLLRLGVAERCVAGVCTFYFKTMYGSRNFLLRSAQRECCAKRQLLILFLNCFCIQPHDRFKS